MLLLLGIWRYIYKGFPLSYDPLYWGAVFPLGMYTAATHRMTQAMPLRFLAFVAAAAWAVTFIGLLRSLLKRVGHQT